MHGFPDSTLRLSQNTGRVASQKFRNELDAEVIGRVTTILVRLLRLADPAANACLTETRTSARPSVEKALGRGEDLFTQVASFWCRLRGSASLISPLNWTEVGLTPKLKLRQYGYGKDADFTITRLGCLTEGVYLLAKG